MRLKIERTALFLFVGGISYGLLELLWRGRTHWTMLLGGVCFLCRKHPPQRVSRSRCAACCAR